MFWIGIQSSWKTTVFTPPRAASARTCPAFPCGKARWHVHHTSGRFTPSPGMPAPIGGAWTVCPVMRRLSNGLVGVACRPNVHVVGRVNAPSARCTRSTVSVAPGMTSTTRFGSAAASRSSLSQNQQRPTSSLPSHTEQRNGQAIGPLTAPTFSSFAHEHGE